MPVLTGPSGSPGWVLGALGWTGKEIAKGVGRRQGPGRCFRHFQCQTTPEDSLEVQCRSVLQGVGDGHQVGADLAAHVSYGQVS